MASFSMPGRIDSTRRAVKAFETSRRIRVWIGGSDARVCVGVPSGSVRGTWPTARNFDRNTALAKVSESPKTRSARS
ncbi:hypothetical protein ACQ4WX_05160 [Streptomyces lasalocidi]